MSDTQKISEKVSELTVRFANDYRIGRSPAVRALERCVLGCDYGGTSWTTRDEAQRVAALLDLRPGLRLLDVGAGSGWPGLYLLTLSGCDAVLTDLPLEGLKAAADRATTDGLADRCGFVVADGAALPFSDASFDAISHSDVLCCTPAKAGLLQACRRAARLQRHRCRPPIDSGRASPARRLSMPMRTTPCCSARLAGNCGNASISRHRLHRPCARALTACRHRRPDCSPAWAKRC
jgi:SAM-dependent methyltransferase